MTDSTSQTTKDGFTIGLAVYSRYDEDTDLFSYVAHISDGPVIPFKENTPAYEYYTALINILEGNE